MNRNYKGSSVQCSNGVIVTVNEVIFNGLGYCVYATSDSTILVKIYESEKVSYPTKFKFQKKDPATLKVHIDREELLQATETASSGQIGQVQVILMEKGILLEKILQKLNKALTEPQVIKIIRDISKALIYIHSQGVVHRDIRSDNVIFGPDGKFKLQNFQRATFQMFTKVPNDIRNQVFDEIDQMVLVRAPEQSISNQFELREKVDIYTLGLLIYQIMFKRKHEAQNAQYIPNPGWQTYSDRLCQLVKVMLSFNPNDRPSAVQVEQSTEAFQIGGSLQPNPHPQVQPQETQIHVRSKSQNSSAILQQTESPQDIVASRFTGLDYVEVGQANKSSLYVQMMKYMSRFANKTEGWVIACIEENEEGPKQKYVRYLIVKAWKKKEKISKFYVTLHKVLKNNSDNAIVALKSLILLHNYFKKGPKEVVVFQQKDISPADLLKRIYSHWKSMADSVHKDNNKNQDNRGSYMSSLLRDYSGLLVEKLRLCVTYKNYFEGNYSLNPFFSGMSKSFKPLSIGLVESLLRFWEKCLIFISILFKENSLVKIQFTLGLSMIDEMYCLLSLLCHLLYAFKHSTNYIEGSQSNLKVLRERVGAMEESFQYCYKSTLKFFSNCKNSLLFSSIANMIPNPPNTMIDTIRSIPLFQTTVGDFNFFEYLDFGKNLDGVKLPLSYGEAVANIKIENEEIISLNAKDERLETVADTVRENRFQPDQQSIKKQDPKQEFSIYNEFSHQTYSRDFNMNQVYTVQANTKDLKLFDFEQQSGKSIIVEEQETKQPNTMPDKLNTGRKSSEFPPVVQKNAKVNKKANKQCSLGYQDLSFSDDEIDDGPDLNQSNPIQSIELNQKASITRALTEKDDFLVVTQRVDNPQSINNFIAEFPPTINTINNPFNSNRQEEYNKPNPFNQFPFNRPPSPKSQIYQPVKIFTQPNAPVNPFTSPTQQFQQPQNRIIYKNNSQHVPQNNQHVPQNNQHVPQKNQQVPQNNQQVPLNNQNFLQNNQHVPQNNQHVPQDNQHVPQNNQHVPQSNQHVQQLPRQLQVPIKQTPAFELYRFITEELNSNINELRLDKQIGTGSSCDVYMGYLKGSEVAVKKMKIKSLSENHLKEFRREITALVNIRPQKNLVSLIGISQLDDELYIVTEYCGGGTLFDLLHRKKNLNIPWAIRIRMCYQIAQGISYLHDLLPPIIHRDLKSLNLLLENPYDQAQIQKVNVKIADFGLARTQVDNGEQMTGVLGTFHWMAPEIFESKPYTIMADVYSFGIVLWEICSRETPYKNFQTPHAIMKYVTFDKGRPDLNSIQDGCSGILRDLIIKCWDHDPNNRLNFHEILSILRKIL